jgi:hypothetical protein
MFPRPGRPAGKRDHVPVSLHLVDRKPLPGRTISLRAVTPVLVGLWLAVGVVGWFGLHDAVADRSDTAGVVVAVCAWAGWGIGLVALAVASTVSLTVIRMIVSLTVPVALVAWMTDLSATLGIACVGVCSVAMIAMWSGLAGDRMVQSSAYGDERRFLLRVPAGHALVQCSAIAIWVVAVLGSVALLAASQWLLAVPSVLVTVGFGALVGNGLHRLHRRWLVFVPTGLVVHDHVVLDETLMLRRIDIAGLGPALATSNALDATGQAAGLAVQIDLRELVRVAIAKSATTPAHGVEIDAMLCRPVRPGSFLDEAAKRRMAQ